MFLYAKFVTDSRFSQILNVACCIKGTSPIPLNHETPLADLIALEALGTDRQNSNNLPKFKVALVIIAIGLVLSKSESISSLKGLIPSHLP